MKTQNELQAARKNLSDPQSSPDKAHEAARLLQKNGVASEVRKLLDTRVKLGCTNERTRLLNVEFTLRDVEGLGYAERLVAASELLDAERDAKGNLNPAFDDLMNVWDKQDALYQVSSIFSREDKSSGEFGDAHKIITF